MTGCPCAHVFEGSFQLWPSVGLEAAGTGAHLLPIDLDHGQAMAVDQTFTLEPLVLDGPVRSGPWIDGGLAQVGSGPQASCFSVHDDPLTVDGDSVQHELESGGVREVSYSPGRV